MPSSFGQYQSGIEAATGNLVPAYAKMAEQTYNSINGVGNDIAEGIKTYAKSKEERDMLEGKISGGISHINKLLDYARENEDNARFVNSKSEQIATWASKAKNSANMSIGALRALANETEMGYNSLNQEFNMFQGAKVAKDNKAIADTGLNDAQKSLTSLAGQLKDDTSNKPLYDSVVARLQELQDVRLKGTSAQGAFLTTTGAFLKAVPTDLAVSEKLGNNVGLQRTNTAFNEVNKIHPTKLTRVEIDTLSEAYDASKSANDNHIVMDELLNKFRETHNIPTSNSNIISKVFANIRDKAKATETRQGNALSEALGIYLEAIPQNLKEVGNVPAGSGYTTTDASAPANVAVTPEVSKKFTDSLAIGKVGVAETVDAPLTDDETKAAVLAKVSKQYGDVTPALFNAWYNSLVPTKPSATVGKIGDAVVVTTKDKDGNIKVTNIPQQKPPNKFKEEKDVAYHNATTFGVKNPTTGLKEDKDADGNTVWEDVGADSNLQISGKMGNVANDQVKLFRTQKVAYSELMTQFKSLKELKKNYSVLLSRGQAPDDSAMEKRITAETVIMKSRLQRVLYPNSVPREWENTNILEAMPELKKLFTYDSTQLAGLEQLEIRLKDSLEQEALGFGLEIRDRPKAEPTLTPAQLTALARQVEIERQVEGQISR